MKTTRKIIEIDEELCNGCGECVTACAEGAIRIIDGKARLISDKYCDGLGACLGDCPMDALKIVERPAEAFVEPNPAPDQAHACPGAQARSLPARAPSQDAGPSALTHWPVQIRLVPPEAPFLQGADLLVAADCAPVAYANFHRDFLRDKVIMVGCPKFDDVELYIDRFTEIFRTNDIKSVTVIVMQVPCCQGLPIIVEKAMRAAGKTIPIEKVVITLDGSIQAQQALAS